MAHSREPAERAVERLFEQYEMPIKVAMEMPSNETIKQAVMAGMGLSFISLHTIGLELEAGRLAVLDVLGLPIVRDWFVIRLREKNLSPIATAFCGFLLENGARIIGQTVGGPSAARPGGMRRGRPAASPGRAPRGRAPV